jgi:hypothetical protein
MRFDTSGKTPAEFALTAILSGITGHKITITRETTFFAAYAKPTA